MPSTVGEAAFGEPSGRRHASVMFAGALVFSGPYVYSATVGAPSSNGWLRFMIVRSAPSGIAEFLPADRWRAAGVLRVTAILVVTGTLAASVFAPDLIVV